MRVFFIFSPDIAWVSNFSYIVDCRLYPYNDTQHREIKVYEFLCIYPSKTEENLSLILAQATEP